LQRQRVFQGDFESVAAVYSRAFESAAHRILVFKASFVKTQVALANYNEGLTGLKSRPRDAGGMQLKHVLCRMRNL
jgi:hypothetical protein